VSNFAIKFQLLSKAKGTQNLNGTEVFSFIPAEAIVQSRKEMEVKLIFKVASHHFKITQSLTAFRINSMSLSLLTSPTKS
jgi:hypothetical protein